MTGGGDTTGGTTGVGITGGVITGGLDGEIGLSKINLRS